MIYKNFNAVIVVNGILFKNPYCNYYINEINKWLAELDSTFCQNLRIEVASNSGVASYYVYDSEDNPEQNLEYSKLWLNGRSYSIFIAGNGLICEGITPNIFPPQEIGSNFLKEISFKYIEQTDHSEPQLFGYGLDLFFPTIINKRMLDTELWTQGTKDCSSLLSHTWKLNIFANYKSFKRLQGLVNALKNINPLEQFNIEFDLENYEIYTSGQFLINKSNKELFDNIMMEISNIFIDDSNEIEFKDFVIDFRSMDPNSYYIETYQLDEKDGLIKEYYAEIP